MILGFLAVESVGNVEPKSGEIDGDGSRKRNALISRTVNHVEIHAAGLLGSKESLRIEVAELIEKRAGVEKSGIEEVGAQTPGFGFEFAETEHVGLKSKLDELMMIFGHDDSNSDGRTPNGGKRKKGHKPSF